MDSPGLKSLICTIPCAAEEIEEKTSLKSGVVSEASSPEPSSVGGVVVFPDTWETSGSAYTVTLQASMAAHNMAEKIFLFIFAASFLFIS